MCCRLVLFLLLQSMFLHRIHHLHIGVAEYLMVKFLSVVTTCMATIACVCKSELWLKSGLQRTFGAV